MNEYENVTLQHIAGLKTYLENLSDDNSVNLRNMDALKPALDDLKPTIIAYVESLDLKRYHKVREYYNDYKRGTHSLHLFLSYNKETLLAELADFSHSYVQTIKLKVFQKKISDMTGLEFNQYLEIIGVIKVKIAL